VRALGVDGGTDMVAAIIHLGRALGMQVVAQGVQGEDQLTILNTLGCDQYQGEIFSEALPGEEMLALLHRLHSQHDGLSTPRAPKTTIKQEDNADEQHD
jgi:EAL domain-containing protein (putative c-di-GMP-specific phosphodiesterase class I)